MRGAPGIGVAVGIAVATSALACKRPPAPAPSPAVVEVDPLAPLRAFEAETRRTARFVETEVQDRAFGPDPYAVDAFTDGHLAGVLRGRDAVVLLDRSLREVARAPAPRAPSAVAVHGGEVFVASEVEPILARYRRRGTALVRLTDIPLGDVVGARGLAIGPEGVAYVVEEHDDRLLTIDLNAANPASTLASRRVARGPIRVVRVAHEIVVASMLGHTLTVHPLDERGHFADEKVATVTTDGPFFSVAASATPTRNELLLVAGGVKDHPLDRRQGFFGHVDSFVHAYRYTRGVTLLPRVDDLDLGELGLIVPKAIAFTAGRYSYELGTTLITSYGGTQAIRIGWSPEGKIRSVDKVPAPPGTSALVATAGGFVAANPLLDAWVKVGGAPHVEHVEHVEPAPDRKDRGDRERLGEALFFTGLMAPASHADGTKSVFSCETCHFEGYGDGRTHHTGRGDVHATTKPLVGLFNNRPHFSRALDPDLSAVAENEFRVAGAGSDTDPHFAIDVADVPWLRHLRLESTHFDPTEVRIALMAYLMRASHRTNPRAAGRATFSALEREGAHVFRARCEGCHEARSAADDPSSRVPLERWESLVFAGGPLVWASDVYARTGVEPYVHEAGARVPSLRRLYKKSPYLTNGSAPDLRAVLRAMRFGGPSKATHGGTLDGEALDEAATAALLAFLDLL